MQIVFGPADSSYGKKIKKTAEEIRKGKKLSEALKKPKLPERVFFLLSAILYFLALPLRKTTPNMKKTRERKNGQRRLGQDD